VGLARAGVEVCGVFRPLKKAEHEEKMGSTPRSRRRTQFKELLIELDLYEDYSKYLKETV
jgi:hypothetical protein